jgi:NTE family protein
MLAQISKLTLELNPPDILIEISKETCGTFDFYKATEIIEIGKNAAKESLDKKNRQMHIA